MKDVPEILEELDELWEEMLEELFRENGEEILLVGDGMRMKELEAQVKLLITKHLELLRTELASEIRTILEFGSLYFVPKVLTGDTREENLRFSAAWHIIVYMNS